MVKTRLTLLDKLNLFLSLYGRLFSGLARFSWYSPFFILALFQLLGMAMFLWYYAPVWIDIIRPIFGLFVPAQAFHYPQYYLVLPTIYAGYESFILGPTLWIILLAVGVYRLDGVFAGKKPSLQEGFNVALQRYLRLLVVWFIETVLVFLILFVPSMLLRDMTAGSPNMSAGIGAVLQIAGFLVTAMLIYATVGIVVEDKRIGDAIMDGIVAFFRYPILTFSIIFIPNILRLILNTLLSDYAPRIISLMNPDLIPAILALYIISGIFVNYFVYGAAVALYRQLE
jgi:hypothetical protein